ncbi:MAG: hypothetical protein ACE1ZI_03615, partial [Acidobacteriota bacterium]
MKRGEGLYPKSSTGLSRLARTLLVAVLLLASGCGQQGAARETGLESSQQRPTIRIAYPGISATIWPFMYGQEKG